MSRQKTPVFVYASILEPWTRLAMASPAVIVLRVSMLPWMWMTEPARASRETQRMFNEKQAALHETGMVMTHAPIRFWLDTMAACLRGQPHMAFAQAMINNSRRVARPSNRRVRDNRKRLGSNMRTR